MRLFALMEKLNVNIVNITAANPPAKNYKWKKKRAECILSFSSIVAFQQRRNLNKVKDTKW